MNVQVDRFRPYPASVPLVNNQLRRQLASIENRSVFVKVEQVQVRHELINFPEIANFTGNQHLEAVGYGSSGILGVYLSRTTAIKIQLQYVDANRRSSDIYFNSTSIVLRPTTTSGIEIDLGGDIEPNPWCSWVFLNDNIIDYFQNGTIPNDEGGLKMLKFFKIAELFLHCIYSTPDDAPFDDANISSFGSLRNFLESIELVKEQF